MKKLAPVKYDVIATVLTHLNAQTDRGEIGNMFIIHRAYLHSIYLLILYAYIFSLPDTKS